MADTGELRDSDRDEVLLYCDGACSPNPGMGGWGVVLVSPRHGITRELSGAEPATTNNRMEIRAAIEGVRALKRPCRVRITTDSEYLKKAFTAGWLEKWQANGWRTAGHKPVLNVDLWQELLDALEPHIVTWAWVRGHTDHPENSRADELAVEARKKLAQSDI
ncbi:ribonuclease HI [bacterium]|nr:ribonuclease HI [bacterium]